jgi:hypothetical protein
MPEFHSSTVDAINALRTRYPEAPFLTLGQTVLWDEPLKAAFCRLLEALAPEALIVAGVHDTDYFAKLSHLETDDAEKFVMLPAQRWRHARPVERSRRTELPFRQRNRSDTGRAE